MQYLDSKINGKLYLTNIHNAVNDSLIYKLKFRF